MAIGERIQFFRKRKGLTQRQLGKQMGFSERTADIRIAQYESGQRTPKAEMIEELAGMLDVAPEAISVPDTDTYLGLMHTFFFIGRQVWSDGHGTGRAGLSEAGSEPSQI